MLVSDLHARSAAGTLCRTSAVDARFTGKSPMHIDGLGFCVLSYGVDQLNESAATVSQDDSVILIPLHYIVF